MSDLVDICIVISLNMLNLREEDRKLVDILINLAFRFLFLLECLSLLLHISMLMLHEFWNQYLSNEC